MAACEEHRCDISARAWNHTVREIPKIDSMDLCGDLGAVLAPSARAGGIADIPTSPFSHLSDFRATYSRLASLYCRDVCGISQSVLRRDEHG